MKSCAGHPHNRDRINNQPHKNAVLWVNAKGLPDAKMLVQLKYTDNNSKMNKKVERHTFSANYM